MNIEHETALRGTLKLVFLQYITRQKTEISLRTQRRKLPPPRRLLTNCRVTIKEKEAVFKKKRPPQYLPVIKQCGSRFF